MEDIFDNIARLHREIMMEYHRLSVGRGDVEPGHIESHEAEEVGANSVSTVYQGRSLGSASEDADIVDAFGLRVTAKRWPGVILAPEAFFREVRDMDAVEPYRVFCQNSHQRSHPINSTFKANPATSVYNSRRPVSGAYAMREWWFSRISRKGCFNSSRPIF